MKRWQKLHKLKISSLIKKYFPSSWHQSARHNWSFYLSSSVCRNAGLFSKQRRTKGYSNDIREADLKVFVEGPNLKSLNDNQTNVMSSLYFLRLLTALCHFAAIFVWILKKIRSLLTALRNRSPVIWAPTCLWCEQRLGLWAVNLLPVLFAGVVFSLFNLCFQKVLLLSHIHSSACGRLFSASVRWVIDLISVCSLWEQEVEKKAIYSVTSVGVCVDSVTIIVLGSCWNMLNITCRHKCCRMIFLMHACRKQHGL